MVTHLHLVHPPTLAVGSAVLAMLFMIAWRFPRSPGPLIAMILVGGCVALFDLASNGIHTVGAVQRGLPVPTLPSLTGIDIVSLLLTALGVALVAYSYNIVTAGCVVAALGRTPRIAAPGDGSGRGAPLSSA